MTAYENRFAPLLNQIEVNLDRMTANWLPMGPGQEKLVEAIRYSLLSPGKRFRPLLSCVVTQSLHGSVLDVLPWGCVIEAIHCYSLIHDDLPCMDNDDTRRGQPTNHKMYGEAMALLAGDALLTEAFGRIVEAYSEHPAEALQLVRVLSEAGGVSGMIGGQALDIYPEKLHGLSFVRSLHEMKTGALIRAAAEGAAIVAKATSLERERARKLGAVLGFAFQLTDDLLDFDPKEPQPANFVDTLGLGAAQNLLTEVTEEAFSLAAEFQNPEDLQFLIRFNLARKK